MASLDKIVKILKKDFKLDLGLEEMDHQSAVTKLHECRKMNTSILLEAEFNSYLQNPEYVKNLLVCEALKLFLSEIAPGRPGAKVKRKHK